jgi:hypothetical protein
LALLILIDWIYPDIGENGLAITSIQDGELMFEELFNDSEDSNLSKYGELPITMRRSLVKSIKEVADIPYIFQRDDDSHIEK